MTEIQTLDGLTSGTYRIVTESGTVLYVNLDNREAMRIPGGEPTSPGFLSMLFDGGDGRVMYDFEFAYKVEVGKMMVAGYEPTESMTGFYRSTPVRSITQIVDVDARGGGH